MYEHPLIPILKQLKINVYKQCGIINYDYSSSKTIVHDWLNKINDAEFNFVFSNLEMNQYGDFVLFKYNALHAYEEGFWSIGNGLYRDCRSVVIDIRKEEIVLLPMKKFFNINEVEETSMENIKKRINHAHTVEFSNKLDGSMQSAGYYNGSIVMAGSQAIDPSNSWRLEDGYRMLYSLPGYEQMIKNNEDFTFVFEYISLKDAHVVKYTKEQEGLYLIGVRNKETGEELPYCKVIGFAHEYDLPTTEIFDKTIDTVVNELDDKTSDEAEGFVINIDGYRVKLKYNDYVRFHNILSKLSSPNVVIKAIADDKYDDLISKVPVAHHEDIRKIAKVVYSYVEDTERKIKAYCDKAPKDSKKDFMLYVENRVPQKYKAYCRESYLGHKINVLKSGSEKAPSYKKMKDIAE